MENNIKIIQNVVYAFFNPIENSLRVKYPWIFIYSNKDYIDYDNLRIYKYSPLITTTTYLKYLIDVEKEITI